MIVSACFSFVLAQGFGPACAVLAGMGHGSQFAPETWRPRAARLVLQWHGKSGTAVRPRVPPLVVPWPGRQRRSGVPVVPRPTVPVVGPRLHDQPVATCEVVATSGSSLAPPASGRQSRVQCAVGQGPLQRESAKAKFWRQRWGKEALAWLTHSEVAQSVNGNPAHVAQAFRGRAGTLSRHWAGWTRVKRYCLHTGLRLTDLAGPAMADFGALFISDVEDDESPVLRQIRGQGPPTLRSCLQALRFLHAKVRLPSVFAQANSPVVMGYALEEGASPLKQACALPLVAVTCAETILREPSECLGLRIFCGVLLCGVWGSLRCGDLLSVDPCSLNLHMGVLRGFCLLTKSKKRGMPFACLGRGLTLGAPAPGWAEVFLAVWTEWRRQATDEGGCAPSFFLPGLSERGLQILGTQAEYWHVAGMLRVVLARAGMADAQPFSAHSMKVTLLAWSGQVASSSPEQRMHQGHHKLQVTDVYGRDETLGALRTQLHVLSALAEGWRPYIAQERGAMQPVLEPLVAVCIPAGLMKEYRYLCTWQDQKDAHAPIEEEVRMSCSAA